MMRPLTVLGLLATLDAAVFACHLLLADHPFLGSLFDLDGEANLPTWLSSFKFAAAGVVAVMCYRAESRTPVATGRRFSRGWLAVAALMLLMSIDETAQLHEALTHWLLSGGIGENVRAAFGATEESDSLLWGVIFSPLLVLIAAAGLLFYASRMRAHRALIGWSVGAVLLLGISLYLEAQEASVLSTRGFVSTRQWSLYRTLIAAEELVELLASSILVFVHYAYAARVGSRD